MGFRKIEKNVVTITTRNLGDVITYQLNPETTELEIDGIFDNAFVEVNGVSSTHPQVNIDLRDLPRKPSVKDKVTVESVLYSVIEPRYDGIGGCLLILKKV